VEPFSTSQSDDIAYHGSRTCMTHDDGNADRVRRGFANRYLFALRHLFPPIINPEDHFLMVHVHKPGESEKERSASVGQVRVHDRMFITKKCGQQAEFKVMTA
jgi:hypothetical protein